MSHVGTRWSACHRHMAPAPHRQSRKRTPKQVCLCPYGHGRIQSSNAAFLNPACITSLEPSLSGRAYCSEKASDMVAGHGLQHIWRLAAGYFNKGMLHGKNKIAHIVMSVQDNGF